MKRLSRALSTTNSVLALWMAVSGIFLFFFYRPTATAPWEDIAGASTGLSFGTVIQFGHRIATPVFLITLALWALILTMESQYRRSSIAALSVLVALGATVTGWFLPWDQIALLAVDVDTDMTGYLPLFGDNVRFVLSNGAVVSVSSVVRVLILHAVLGAVLLGSTLVVARDPESETREVPEAVFTG